MVHMYIYFDDDGGGDKHAEKSDKFLCIADVSPKTNRVYSEWHQKSMFVQRIVERWQ